MTAAAVAVVMTGAQAAAVAAASAAAAAAKTAMFPLTPDSMDPSFRRPRIHNDQPPDCDSGTEHVAPTTEASDLRH